MKNLRDGQFPRRRMPARIHRAGVGFALFLVMMLGASCARQTVPVYTPPLPYPTAAELDVRSSETGSLWAEPTNPRWSLIADDKAMNIGDIVQVEVVADTVAETEAETGTSKSSKVESSVETLLGYRDKIPSPNDTSLPLIAWESDGTYDGEAETNRSNSITARVSCAVTEVFPNGHMRIQGSQSVNVNNEDSLLIVEGIVRPSDINLNNTVRSSQIANARISYTGRGVVSDVQRPGLATRGYNWLWPF